jgi:hypothetical protein
MNASSVVETNEPSGEGTPTPEYGVTGASSSKPPVPPQPVAEIASPAAPAAPKAVEKRRPLVELAPLEPIRVQKKLILEPIGSEELAERLYSILMNQLGLTVSYVYKNYGEKSGARLWQYLGEVAELSQSKRRKESFEDFIKTRVEEDRVLGIEHQVSEFYDDKFVSHVRNCKLKTSMLGSGALAGRLQEDLPCMLCESTWQGSCRAMGFQLQLKREKEGCTISVGKTESKR